jgi:hypothetical protein
LLAEYISTEYAKPAIAFYCFGGVVNSLGWNLLFHTLYKPKKLIHPKINVNMINTLKRSIQFGFVIYAGTTVLAFWFPIIALIINLLLWIVWISLSITTKSN